MTRILIVAMALIALMAVSADAARWVQPVVVVPQPTAVAVPTVTMPTVAVPVYRPMVVRYRRPIYMPVVPVPTPACENAPVTTVPVAPVPMRVRVGPFGRVRVTYW